jgi:penicillin-binding protein 1A
MFTLYPRLLKIIFVLIGVSLTFVGGALFFMLHHQTIDFAALEHQDSGSPSVLLDIHGKEWGRFQLDRRAPIPLDQMSVHIVNAFIATEDWAFFKHSGISWKGIVRSMVYNVYYGRKVQGASTITQQLVRMLFLNAKKTFLRKIVEQWYAILVEQQFTKEQILQTYLNNVYFGCGIYGVQAASQRFWGKSADSLTIDEAATLAGIVRSPGNYCPLTFPLSSQKRRNVVLHSMHKLNFITSDEYDLARAITVAVKETDQKNSAPHFKETLRLFLEDLLGKELLYSGGLIVQTTIDNQMQLMACKAFNEQCALIKKDLDPNIDGALISIEVSTGEIRALIGGMHFKESKFNRALQARRQIGSIFKPLVFAAAMQKGMHFYDTMVDEPVELKDGQSLWQPKNFNGKFSGQVTLAYGLSHSSNIIALKVLLELGIPPIVDLAARAHIQGPIYPYPSLALGCVDATLKEAVGMFNIFAHHGVYVEPHGIRWIKDRWGEKIWKAEPVSERVLDAAISGKVAKVLMLGLQRVRTWMPGKWLDAQAISKTGTTNDCRTCWFVGATPTLTTAVYIGCDGNSSMGTNIFPSRTAFPIWLNFNRELACAQREFAFDPSLREVFVHEKTGLPAKKGAPGAIAIFV